MLSPHPGLPFLPPQAGSHFDEDQRLVAAAKLEKGSLAAEAEAAAV